MKQDGTYFRSKSYQWVYIYEKTKQVFHYDKSKDEPSNPLSYSPIKLVSKGDRFVYTGFHPTNAFTQIYTYDQQHAIKEILVDGLKHGNKAIDYIRQDVKDGGLYKYTKTMVVVADPYLSTLDRKSDWLGTFDHQLPPRNMKAFFDVKRKDCV